LRRVGDRDGYVSSAALGDLRGYPITDLDPAKGRLASRGRPCRPGL